MYRILIAQDVEYLRCYNRMRLYGIGWVYVKCRKVVLCIIQFAIWLEWFLTDIVLEDVADIMINNHALTRLKSSRQRKVYRTDGGNN